MLVLRRKTGQWTEVRHEASGETFRFRTYDFQQDGTFQIAFDDLPRPGNRFTFIRPEAAAKPAVERLERR